MTQLPTNRTSANSVQEHVDDHNTLAAEHNELDGHASATTTVHGITDTSTLVTTSDSRLSDARTPSDGSVTNAKVAANAAIAKSKLAALAIVNADVDAAAAIAESKLSLASDAAAGTASRRTLGTGATQACAGNDSRLSDTRTPTSHHTSHEPGGGDAMAVDAAAATGSLRTLGTGAAQACAGNDSRLSDTRTPTDGTVTNAKVASNAAIAKSKLASLAIVDADVDAAAAIAETKLSLASDAAAGTASRRSLGTSSTQAAAGNHAHSGTYEAAGTTVPLSTVTTKGDLIAGTANATVARLAAGTNGRGLVADSTATPGVAWGGPPSLRDLAFMPTGAIAETISRLGHINTNFAMTSASLFLTGIALPAGAVISNITFVSSTQAAVTPANWWFALFDSGRVQLATTADQTTTAWAANTAKTLAIATTAGGAASSFTTTYAGLHYLGFMMKAATPINVSTPLMGSALYAIAPVIFGSANGSQTGPNAFPFTATALAASQCMPYAYVS